MAIVRPAPELLTLPAIEDAAQRISGVAAATPLVPLPASVGSGRVLLKAESLQPIGAFKIRGAYNAVASLPADVRHRGVLAASSGNHGFGVARAARILAVDATIVMPTDASPRKASLIRAEGATIIDWDPGSTAGLHDVARSIAADRDLRFIHPFDDPSVMAGQGTIGLEIVGAVPDLAAVIAPIGGGGLISGIATAVKALRPAVRVVGVEPALAADARDSFRAGQVVTWPEAERRRTIADGTRTNISARTLAHLLAFVDDVVAVSEDEIRAAMALIAKEGRLVAEPSGALATAAAAFHFDELGIDGSGTVVAVLSGGNVAPEVLADVLNQAP